MVKKVLMWLGVAFVIWFIAFNPNAASNVVESLGGVIKDIATGFATFFGNLAD